MTVADLIDELIELGEDARSLRVYTAKDYEGNGFNSAFEIEVGWMDEEDHYAEEDKPENAWKCVVIWP